MGCSKRNNEISYWKAKKRSNNNSGVRNTEQKGVSPRMELEQGWIEKALRGIRILSHIEINSAAGGDRAILEVESENFCHEDSPTTRERAGRRRDQSNHRPVGRLLLHILPLDTHLLSLSKGFEPRRSCKQQPTTSKSITSIQVCPSRLFPTATTPGTPLHFKAIPLRRLAFILPLPFSRVPSPPVLPSTMSSKKLLWIDCEMTGLHAFQPPADLPEGATWIPDRILEVSKGESRGEL